MFIIDFDDTLFDTHAFKKARMRALKELGVSGKIFLESYRQARSDKHGIMTYSDTRHAEVLSKWGFNREETLKVLEATTWKMREFLFAGACEFLEQLRRMKQKMVLLSLGESNFQKIKVAGTGVNIYFDEIYTVDDTKKQVVKKILAAKDKLGKAIFINDKINETVDLVKRFPELCAVLKVSPMFSKEEYRASGLPHFQSLAEILGYVQRKLK